MELEQLEKMMDIIKKDEMFGELNEWAQETQSLFLSFAHGKDCGSVGCPASCCEDQLTPLSALFWEMAAFFRDINTFTKTVKEKDTIDSFQRLSKVHEILYQLNHVLEFKYRAGSHKRENYFEEYWFWGKIGKTKEEARNWCGKISSLFRINGCSMV